MVSIASVFVVFVCSQWQISLLLGDTSSDDKHKHSEWSPDTATMFDEQGQAWLDRNEVYSVWNSRSVQLSDASLSYKDFATQFGEPQLPALIRGALSDNELTKLSWKDVDKIMGDQEVSVSRQKKVKGNDPDCEIGWANLCAVPEQTVSSLIRDHILISEQDGEPQGPFHYGHDIEMETSLSYMFDKFGVLSIFAEDILGFVQDSGWPTVFLAPKGSQSGLHVDAIATAFTMTVLTGHKQFILFAPTETEKLCPKQDDVGFNINVFAPDFTSCASAYETHPYVVDVLPGDVLYVPSNFAHAARNLASGIAASTNFIGRFQYESFKQYIHEEEWLEGDSALNSRDALDASWMIEFVHLLEMTSYDPSESMEDVDTIVSVDQAREQAREYLSSHLRKNIEKEKVDQTLMYFVHPDNTLEEFLNMLQVEDFLPLLQHHEFSLLDILGSCSSVDAMQQIDDVNAQQWMPVQKFITIRWHRLLNRLEYGGKVVDEDLIQDATLKHISSTDEDDDEEDEEKESRIDKSEL